MIIARTMAVDFVGVPQQMLLELAYLAEESGNSRLATVWQRQYLSLTDERKRK